MNDPVEGSGPGGDGAGGAGGDDAGGEALPPEWTAPVDARELDADLQALWREHATAARRGANPPARPRRRPPRGQALVIVLLLLGVAATAVALVIGAPIGAPTRSAARPLAQPDGTPGTVGALLPEVTLAVGESGRKARELRPAVLAILPVPCDCAAALRAVATDAGQYAVPLILVTPANNREIPALLRAVNPTRAYPALDRASALAEAYTASGLTLLLVRADGVVTEVERDVGPGRRFGVAFSQLGA